MVASREYLAPSTSSELLIAEIKRQGTTGLTIASNNAGVDGFGLGQLLEGRQVKKMISSYVGENAEFMRQFLAGELDVEFNPQGTLAERMRAGGAGIPGFYTRTGVGTVIADGKELKEFDGETYVLERGLVADLSIVKAWKADPSGNLVFRKTARNFNPPAATCGKVCVAEVEDPHVVFVNGAAVFVAQQILEQDLEGERELADMADARFGECGNSEVVVGRASGGDL